MPYRLETPQVTSKAWIVLALAVAACLQAFIFGLAPERAQATRTDPAKTYWHSVGNDRFRAYDVGGEEETATFAIPTFPVPKIVTVPWNATALNDQDHGVPGPAPYPSKYGSAWPTYKGLIRASNIRYSRYVDWPVTMIFRNDASIARVKHGFENQGFNNSGSRMFLSLSDSSAAGQGHHLWDRDAGLKESKCSNKFIGPDTTNHIRLYADSQGLGWKNQNDKMYNPSWGFYVLGTTHLDYLECPRSDATRFGWSDAAQDEFVRQSIQEWGKWNQDCSLRPIFPCGSYIGSYFMANKEPLRRQGDHVWQSDGFASVVKVGRMPSPEASASNSEVDDPDPDGGGYEEEPPLEPAIDGDVDGDDKADLVALHTSGTAYTFKGSDGSSKATGFGGGMNSSLFDGSEHHVIDVADVDADGFSDLVTLSSNSPLGLDNVICVFPGQEDGSFGAGVLARGGVVPGTFGPSGHEPIGVADVTGDQRADLVTFYAPQGNLYVYPGLESRQFGDGITRGGGQVNSALFDRQGTYFVDVKDVSGDGKADVVGLSNGSSRIFPGTEWGVTQWSSVNPPQIDSILDDGSGSEPVGLGDVNGDGKGDLVIIDPGGNVAVYAGMHEIFAPTETYQLLATTPVTSLAGQNSSLMDRTGDDHVGLLDKTGDGKDDLVKVAEDGSVSVAPGQANLQFGAFSAWVSGVTSNRRNVGAHELVQEKPFVRRIGCVDVGCIGRPKLSVHSDVDGDRRADLVTLDNTGTSHTYRGIGAVGHGESFPGAMDSALYDGKGHHVIDVADVDGDLRADKVTLSAGTVYVHRGKSDGTFGAGVGSFGGTIAPGPHDPNGYVPIAVADVTGDQKGDLVLHKEGVGVKVAPGAANGTFGEFTTSLSGLPNSLFGENVNDGTFPFDVVDVTGDGLADLVTIGERLDVFAGTSSGAFVFADYTNTYWTLDGSGTEPVGMADVNGDERADLVTLNGGTIRVYEGKTTGKFQLSNYEGPTPSGSSFNGSMDSNLFDGVGDEIAGLLDEDGDRRADLVTVRGDGTARVYSGRNDFTFNSTPKVRSLPGFAPGRFNRQPGHEIASEKPFYFRPGCQGGCYWPPMTVESDVNGDRRSDVVATHTNGSAQVFQGHANGVYGTSTGSLSGEVPPALFDRSGDYTIDVADVTGDRLSDLVTLSDAGSVQVYPGRGDRTFGTAKTSEFSLPPTMHAAEGFEPIAVADVTGDQRADLVGFQEASGGSFLATFAGLGDGRFVDPESETAYSQQGAVNSALKDGSGDYFLDAVDVDGDALADLVSVASSGTVRVYKGQADGKFATALTAATGVDPIMDNGSGREPAGLGDVTGDGRADLLVLNGSLQLYAGKANGSFAAPTSPFAGNTPNPANIDSSLIDGRGQEFIGLLDYSRDGRADLVTAVHTSSGYTGFKTYEAQTDGTFALPWDHNNSAPSHRFGNVPGLQFATEKPFLLRAGCRASGCEWPHVNRTESDVDGDHRSDVVTLHTNGSVYVYGGGLSGVDFETASASFAGSIDPALFDGEGDYMDDVADVDGDGHGDLVTENDGGDVFVHRGGPDRTFGSAIEAYSIDAGLDETEPLAVADVNGDHRADLVQYGSDGEKGLVLVAPGLADGTFSAATDTVSLQGSVDSALLDHTGEYFVDAMDVTGDDRADLVSIGTSGTVRLYKGQADGKFAAGIEAVTGLNPGLDDAIGNEPIGLGDITADGKADLVVIGSGGLVKLYAGKADGTFAALSNAYPSGLLNSSLMDGTGTDLIGLLDYNGDGNSDLVTTGKNGVVKIHKALGDGTFSTGTLQSGSLTPNRFDVRPAEQMVNEKPFLRRAGCVPTGCTWPPTPPAEPGEAEAGEWSPMPLGEATSHLDDVWCDTSWECLAVGDATSDSGVLRAQVSRWDGNEWTASSPIEAEEDRLTELSGVTCVASECTAVGRTFHPSTGVRALVLKEDGTSWEELSVPAPSGAKASKLIEISCASSSLCMAVGSYVDASDVRRTLALRWNGSAWAVSATPSSQLSVPPSYYLASSSELTDVSCPTTTMCAAVGTFVDYDTGKTKALGLEWDGSTWTVAPTPGMGGSTPRELSGVSCAEASSCIAVGSFTASSGEKRNWALDWDGSEWGSTGAPNPTSEGSLSSVTCAGSTCVAAGSSRVSSGMRPTVLEWDDTAWAWEGHLLALPDGAASAELAAIACVGSDCNAVGSVRYGDSGARNAGYAFDGSAGSVTDAGGPGGALRSVSCSSETECVAIGDAALPAGPQDLALGWALDGDVWQPSATADVSGPILADVSCASATACSAVGTQNSGWPPKTLAEHWDGEAWTEEATPVPGSGNVSLNGVSCYTANGCVSVGWYSQSGSTLPTSQLWNGSAWSSASVPAPGSTPTLTLLHDVACTAANNCIAVGSSSASSNYALAELWNGSAWSVQATSLPSGAVGAALKGISCSSASACTAVGTYQTNPGWVSHPLVLRWNGSAWSVQLSSPPAGATKATINDVSCYSASGCVAVGDHSTATASKLPLAMRWDGSSWTLEGIAAPEGEPEVSLEAVSCPTAGSCRAVGRAEFGSGHTELYALENQ